MTKPDPIAEKLLKIIKKEVPYSEKGNGFTKYGEWYKKNVDDTYDFSTAAWCNMFLSWAATKAEVNGATGQFAYTVDHANWFKKKKAWSKKAEPGAFVFFDWGGSKQIGNIDHVGIVEKVNGGKIHTIEGNIDNGNLKKKVRGQDKVVGYGLPRKVKETNLKIVAARKKKKEQEKAAAEAARKKDEDGGAKAASAGSLAVLPPGGGDGGPGGGGDGPGGGTPLTGAAHTNSSTAVPPLDLDAQYSAMAGVTTSALVAAVLGAAVLKSRAFPMIAGRAVPALADVAFGRPKGRHHRAPIPA